MVPHGLLKNAYVGFLEGKFPIVPKKPKIKLARDVAVKSWVEEAGWKTWSWSGRVARAEEQ